MLIAASTSSILIRFYRGNAPTTGRLLLSLTSNRRNAPAGFELASNIASRRANLVYPIGPGFRFSPTRYVKIPVLAIELVLWVGQP